MEPNTLLVIGGAGFIGANFILGWRQSNQAQVVNVDKLTHVSNPMTLETLAQDESYCFVRADITNPDWIGGLLEQYQPYAILNFAAESHVDRSILTPQVFVETNVLGTFHLLEACRVYWQQLPPAQQDKFRFIQISTDEVYGSLTAQNLPSREGDAYGPNSPYSASKAGADHLVRAYYRTYSLPTIITTCSNNYGPYQFPEKLIPCMILNAQQQQPLPIYGDGRQIRDWIYVADHCHALAQVLAHGRIGETYNIGGGNQQTNLAVVEQICSHLDALVPQPGCPYSSLITFVKDRPGHDRRYALDCTKIQQELGWQPQESFDSGLLKTIQWYLENDAWLAQAQSAEYRRWVDLNYGQRDLSI